MPKSAAALLSILCVSDLAAQRILRNDFRAAVGYTFFSPAVSTTSYLMRNDGQVVHEWTGNGRPAIAVYLLPDGSILRTGIAVSPAFQAGAGPGGRIDQFTWNGERSWTYTLADNRYFRHHDIEPLPNGNVLVIAWERKSREEAIAAGRDPARVSSAGMWAEAILEVRPTRPSGAEVVWEWHIWDHLIQDFDPQKANFGDVAAHPERMDINYGDQTPDWLHFNAVAYNPALDQIAVSSRTLSEIWIINHRPVSADAAGHAGDLLYRWGNPRVYRAGGTAAQRLFDQHAVHWIAPGLPGQGNLLIFSNGSARNFSTVEEIVPPLTAGGTYHRAAARFGPERALRTFGDGVGPRFLSRTFGGAQRLPNGNTLICASNENRLIEVTLEGATVWEADISAVAAGGGTFRATRFPVHYEGFRSTPWFNPAPDVVNAANPKAVTFAPGSLATALGDAMGGLVEVTDGSGIARRAGVFHAASGRVEFRIPPQVAIGPARVLFDSGVGVQWVDIRIDPVAPALFSADGSGTGVGAIVAARLRAGAQSWEPAFTAGLAPQPLSLGDPAEQLYLMLFGTGIGRAHPGEMAVTIGGAGVPVTAAAELTEYPGIDQVNVGPLPPTLAGKGESPVELTVRGVRANVVTVWFGEPVASR